ncbi:hypothetical protein PR048_031311 [Dryococelus australis]|uniref:Uncharacterized protein n=1 Tax=Dryococelus australis TaxID=614101 RepID=A0ABQ9G8Z7_9NEOP|nr:hypothetical protein PR048_031311 [Dryococelus australis]
MEVNVTQNDGGRDLAVVCAQKLKISRRYPVSIHFVGSLPIFACSKRVRRCHWLAGFAEEFPLLELLRSYVIPSAPHFAPIGSPTQPTIVSGLPIRIKQRVDAGRRRRLCCMKFVLRRRTATDEKKKKKKNLGSISSVADKLLRYCETTNGIGRRSSNATQRNAVLLLTDLSAKCIGGHRGVVVILLSSDLGEPGSIPGGGNSWILACGNRGGQCRWSAGFLGDLPFTPSSLHRTSPRFTLVGFQDLYVKSCPDIFTRPFIHSECIIVATAIFIHQNKRAKIFMSSDEHIKSIDPLVDTRIGCLLSQWKATIGPAFSRRCQTPCGPMAKNQFCTTWAPMTLRIIVLKYPPMTLRIIVLEYPTVVAIHSSPSWTSRAVGVKEPAYLSEVFSAFEAEKRASDTDDPATHIKCAIALKKTMYLRVPGQESRELYGRH